MRERGPEHEEQKRLAAEEKRDDLRGVWKTVFTRILEREPSLDTLRDRIMSGEFEYVQGGLTPTQVPRDLISQHIAASEHLRDVYRSAGIPLQEIQLDTLNELAADREHIEQSEDEAA